MESGNGKGARLKVRGHVGLENSWRIEESDSMTETIMAFRTYLQSCTLSWPLDNICKCYAIQLFPQKMPGRQQVKPPKDALGKRDKERAKSDFNIQPAGHNRIYTFFWAHFVYTRIDICARPGHSRWH
jgi:hypothetical protein